jgi:SAM-dependent methyltransferase
VKIKKLRKAVRRLMSGVNLADRLPKANIDRHCPGYSRDVHWKFFKAILRNPDIHKICVLGVYFGRDIGYLATMLRARGQPGWAITGVDYFEDSAGADWPAEKRGLNWQEAGYGPAPSLEKARACLANAGFSDGITLLKDSAENFLQQTNDAFDLIYVDIAHDYQSTKDALRLSMRCLRPGGVIAGDDFSNEGTWGVARAVEEVFSQFELHGSWIWQAKKHDYRGSLA